MKPVHDVADLLTTLRTIRENAIYSIFCQKVFHEMLKELNKNGILPNVPPLELPEGNISLKEFILIHAQLDGNLLTLKQNVNRDTVKHMFKESFRLTQSFCNEKNIYSLFEKLPFYNFARITVNCLSHGFTIQLRKKDKELLPVEYNGHKITEDSHGEKLSITLTELVSMNDEIIEFVKSLELEKE